MFVAVTCSVVATRDRVRIPIQYAVKLLNIIIKRVEKKEIKKLFVFGCRVLVSMSDSLTVEVDVFSNISSLK